jgi:hypothetical protein
MTTFYNVGRSHIGFPIRDARLTGVDQPRGDAITVDLR